MKKRLSSVMLVVTFLGAAILIVTYAVWAGTYERGLFFYRLGLYPITVEDFKAAAKQGDARAQLGLGDMYYDGKGVPQDYAQAASLYKWPAQQGLTDAQFKLGVMLLKGIGVSQNDKQAAHFIELAAIAGLPEAQFKLGFLFKKGLGVKQDLYQAKRWTKYAAENGYRGPWFLDTVLSWCPSLSVKRVHRLTRLMGLASMDSGPNTNKKYSGHKAYPYLLRGLAVVRPNQVWSTHITNIRLARGFVFLVTIIDWYDRIKRSLVTVVNHVHQSHSLLCSSSLPIDRIFKVLSLKRSMRACSRAHDLSA